MPPLSAFQVAEANIRLLSGDDWAPWFVQQVDQALTSIHLSIYMISDHWRSPEVGKLNLVDSLVKAGLRGLTCRCIIDQPHNLNRRIPFNTKAARKLQAAGWKIRIMPTGKTLHEKILLLDKQLVVIGSHNISKASAISNFDTSLAVDSAALAERIYRQFWQRWRVAVPFVADVWLR
ncbi:phospholipase D-like domain-containing protein [Methylobacter psychrophilus]|uniref:phospholipase D-like domain-containing protein n=1 Tax=Methylobacter psychrophilus TaxID=96941 RepID=UPI0021D4A5AD|nr:phospholipase D-like domain-containing protein [Methylobacter psychrophilus]